MKSSAGSDVFVVFSLLAIFAFTLLILRHYLQLRKTPAFFVIPLFLALSLPISIIILLPIDLASSSRSEDEKTRGIWLPDGAVLVGWRIIYWLTFALTWYTLTHNVDEIGAKRLQGYPTFARRVCRFWLPSSERQVLLLSTIQWPLLPHRLHMCRTCGHIHIPPERLQDRLPEDFGHGVCHG